MSALTDKIKWQLKMKSAKTPQDHAKYKRLFRKAKNRWLKETGGTHEKSSS